MKYLLTVILFLVGVLVGFVLNAKPKPQETHNHYNYYQYPQWQPAEPYKITWTCGPTTTSGI